LPVMIELFRRMAANQIKPTDTLVPINTFFSLADGSPYTLNVDDDSDEEMYQFLGKPVTMLALCEHMITRSSNLAANTLIQKLGAKHIQSTSNKYGGSSLHILRGVEDQKAFDKGLLNTTDAMGLFNLLVKLGRGEVVGSTASNQMVAILK